VLSSLRESGRQIITLHYHQQEWQMRQIAQAMNVYESCISQPSGVTQERVSVLLAVPVQRSLRGTMRHGYGGARGK
jgi:cell division protein ZapA (FtsZ GTPase activity inhibitor)